MRLRSKVFYVLFFMICCSVVQPVHSAENSPKLFNQSILPKQTPPPMQSKTWKQKKPDAPKEEIKPEKEELTADEKLWKKYKDLAAGKGKKDKDTPAGKAENSEDAEIEAKPEESVKDDRQKAQEMGIRSVIDAYKNTNSKKGNLNSRSFGND